MRRAKQFIGWIGKIVSTTSPFPDNWFDNENPGQQSISFPNNLLYIFYSNLLVWFQNEKSHLTSLSNSPNRQVFYLLLAKNKWKGLKQIMREKS